MSDPRSYYWLKLKRDFFKRHDTKIIRSMENGEKYLIFYLTLLVESIDHNGKLRFSDTVPYNDSMLSTITDTDIDIVRSAVKIFCELGMMECFDDGTFYMAKVVEMTGCETEWAEKKRLYREKEDRERTIEGQKKTLSDKSKSIELDIRVRDKSNINTFDVPPPPKPKRAKKPKAERDILRDALAESFKSKIPEYANPAKENSNLLRLTDAIRRKARCEGIPEYDAAKGIVETFWKLHESGKQFYADFTPSKALAILESLWGECKKDRDANDTSWVAEIQAKRMQQIEDER
jgi:predicted phage replisome organizer